jgi:trigger factor
MERPDTGELDGLVEGEAHSYTAEVDVRPELTLSGTEGLKAVVPTAKTADEEIEAQIDYLRDRFAQLEVVEGRGVADGDFALVSFTGTVDGKPAEDLVVDKYLYEVGRGIMPPGFDEGLTGAEAGSSLHVELPVPDNATNPDYIGKTAAFDVEVHEVKAKKVPEADDEFAMNVSGLETIAELRDDIRAHLDENKLAAHGRLVEREARVVLAGRLEGAVPQRLVDARIASMNEEFFDSLRTQGYSMSDYEAATGLTHDEIRDDLAREAALRVREDLALEALFRTVGLEYDDEELDAEIAELAESDKLPIAEMRERLMASGVMGLVRERIVHRHATRWLMDNVEIVEEEPNAAAGEKPKKEKGTSKKKSAKADETATEE